MISNHDKRRGVLYGVIILSIILVFATIFFIILVNFVSPQQLKSGNVEDHLEEYKFLEFNTETGEYSNGFVRVPKLIDHEFLFKDFENGKYSLISKMSDEEYKCTGTCYCEENEGYVGMERLSANILSKGLLYFLAAPTSLLAIQLAERYFESTCKDDYKETLTCEKSEVKSEVDDCKKVGPGEIPKEEIFEEGEEEKFYWCKSECYPKQEGDVFEEAKKEVSEEEEKLKKICNELKMEGEVRVTQHDQFRFFSLNVAARDKFVEEFMEPYCSTQNPDCEPSEYLTDVRCRYITK